MEPVQRTYTPRDIERLQAEVIGLAETKRLLNSGPGGIAQLRRIVHEKHSEAKDKLALAVTYCTASTIHGERS